MSVCTCNTFAPRSLSSRSVAALKTVLSLLSEPLGLLLLAVLAGGLLSLRRYGWRSAAVIWAPVFVVLFGLATPLGANALIKPLEERAAAASLECPAAAPSRTLVILLAGGFEGPYPDSDEIESLQIASFRRSIGAVQRMAQLTDAKLLISGGEARVLRAFVERLGLDADRIVIENRSMTTAASATAMHAVIDGYQPARIELITTAMHMPRALASMRRAGIAACAVAVDFRYKRTEFPTQLLPQATALQKSTDTMHEYFGLLYYLISGRA